MAGRWGRHVPPVPLLSAFRSTITDGRVFLLERSTRGRASTAGRSGQPTLLEPNVHERHHGLQLPVTDQTEQTPDVDKVDEARVQLFVSAQVPKLHPVRVVDVGVAAQHLAVDVSDVGAKVGREVAGFAEPGLG